MKTPLLFTSLALLAMVPLMLGCSSSSSSNHPPAIDYVTATPDTVQSNGVSALYVNAGDPDNNPLTYIWQAPAGNIEGSGMNVTWHAPDYYGTFSIVCTVKDSHGAQDMASVDVSVLTRTLSSYTETASLMEIPVNYGRWNSQGFQLPRDAVIDTLAIKIDSVVGAPGNIGLAIYDDEVGHPGQMIVQGALRVGSVGWHLVPDPQPHFVHGNVPLHLVVWSTVDDVDNYYGISADAAGTYVQGDNQYSEDAGTNWSNRALVDMNFKIIGRWR